MDSLSPSTELKIKNRNRVYQYIWKEQSVTRQDLVKSLDLSLPTVTTNLNQMLKEHLIKKNGYIENTGGRNAVTYSIIADSKVAIGVDINQRHISSVIIDLKGNILAHYREYKQFEKTNEYYQHIETVINRSIQQVPHIKDSKILGVGISIQGIVSKDTKEVIYGQILDITGEKIDTIGRFINLPKSLYHDSDMAAFGEMWHRQELQEAVYISLSTNLGGTYISKGINESSNYYGKGRIEHMTIVADGKDCYCGQKGCAESYCSASVLTELVPDRRLDTFFNLINDGDKMLKEKLNSYLKMLSIVINNSKVMFDCPIILGGYMAEYLDAYLGDLKQLTYQRNSFNKNDDYIILAENKTEPIAVGAALQYVESFISSI